MPKSKGNSHAVGEPKFSAGNVRVGIYQILDRMSDVNVKDTATLHQLYVSPDAAVAAVNELFFPAPNQGIIGGVSDNTTVFTLISTTIHELSSQGRLNP